LPEKKRKEWVKSTSECPRCRSEPDLEIEYFCNAVGLFR